MVTVAATGLEEAKGGRSQWSLERVWAGPTQQDLGLSVKDTAILRWLPQGGSQKNKSPDPLSLLPPISCQCSTGVKPNLEPEVRTIDAVHVDSSTGSTCRVEKGGHGSGGTNGSRSAQSLLSQSVYSGLGETKWEQSFSEPWLCARSILSTLHIITHSSQQLMNSNRWGNWETKRLETLCSIYMWRSWFQGQEVWLPSLPRQLLCNSDTGLQKQK